MAEPTEADRERAKGIRQQIHQTLGWPLQDALIAQALADERERARAPFLALADGWDEPRSPDSPWSVTARLIRRAAEGAGQ